MQISDLVLNLIQASQGELLHEDEVGHLFAQIGNYCRLNVNMLFLTEINAN